MVVRHTGGIVTQSDWDVYIDGQAVRGEAQQFLRRYFETSLDEVEFTPNITSPIGITGKRFFYDALPAKIDGEEQGAFETRLARRQAEFARISALERSHVCTGMSRARSGRGRREPKIEQKGVDVLLTVDVLRATYTGVTNQVVLVTGDIDFLPLVDQLISMGVNVLLFHPRAVADELMAAADYARPLQPYVPQFLRLSSEQLNALPREVRYEQRDFDTVIETWAESGGGAARLGKQGAQWVAEFTCRDGASRMIAFEGPNARCVLARAEDHGHYVPAKAWAVVR